MDEVRATGRTSGNARRGGASARARRAQEQRFGQELRKAEAIRCIRMGRRLTLTLPIAGTRIAVSLAAAVHPVASRRAPALPRWKH